MSKAFTSEETPDDPIVHGPRVRRGAGGERQPITREGYEALVAGHRALEQALAQVGTLPPEARAETRARLEHRLALAAADLGAVQVVEPRGDARTIRFGHWVTVTLDGRERRVRLVGVTEADAARGWISVESPLGRALLGLAVGDDFEVERPQGVEDGTVIDIDTDAGGDEPAVSHP